jgi:hypothetical protein
MFSRESSSQVLPEDGFENLDARYQLFKLQHIAWERISFQSEQVNILAGVVISFFCGKRGDAAFLFQHRYDVVVKVVPFPIRVAKNIGGPSRTDSSLFFD